MHLEWRVPCKGGPDCAASMSIIIIIHLHIGTYWYNAESNAVCNRANMLTMHDNQLEKGFRYAFSSIGVLASLTLPSLKPYRRL